MISRTKPALFALALCALPFSAFADSTELEVYRTDLADEGESNVDFAANVVKSAISGDDRKKTAVFQAVGEYSYGLDDEWQIGLKLPVSESGGIWKAGGLLAEIKYLAPHQKDGWYWGAEVELGYESTIDEAQQWTTEITPIIGWKNDAWEATFNPGISLASAGEIRGVVAFEPSARLARSIGGKSSLGIEFFSEAGALRNPLPGRERNELGFLTLDTKLGKSTINLGIGHGLNSASPGLALKTVIDLEFD